MHFFPRNSVDNSICSRRRSFRRRGYGLLETLICLSLVALLFLGAMTLIMTATRSTVRTQAEVFATGDAANAIQNIVGQLRQASAFALPTSSTAGSAESTWNSMGATPLTQFSTTLNGETINTAIEVLAPQIMTPAANGYTASGVQNLQVLSTTGAVWSANAANWPVGPYNVQVPGTVTALIYRGDPDGTPDPNPAGNPKPNAGTYLWQYTLPPNGSFNPAVYPPTALCKSVSIAPDAVQFVRAVYNGVAEEDQLEVKVISSYYSPINGQQTSEEGGGATSSQLTGKCVFMRDHCTASSSYPANPGTRTGNNTFQFN